MLCFRHIHYEQSSHTCQTITIEKLKIKQDYCKYMVVRE